MLVRLVSGWTLDDCEITVDVRADGMWHLCQDGVWRRVDDDFFLTLLGVIVPKAEEGEGTRW